MGSRLVASSIEIPDNVIGNCLDRLRDECLASRRVPRCLAMTQTKLMDRLAELLEEEDIPQSFEALEHRRELTIGIHMVLSLPLKFDINRSIFLLTVTKRGRLLGKIHIKHWALFGCSKFIQELGDFCIGNPRKIGRRIVKVFFFNELIFCKLFLTCYKSLTVDQRYVRQFENEERHVPARSSGFVELFHLGGL